MSTKTEIQEIARLNNLKITDNDRNWPAFNKLKVRLREHRITTAFTRWAENNRFSPPNNALAVFLRDYEQYDVADSDTPGTPTSYQAVAVDSGLDELCTELCLINTEPFSGRLRAQLSELRKFASDKEIKDAYTELIFDYEEKDLKFAPRKFAEGGGKDLINVARKRAQLQKDQDALQEKLTLEFQQKRAAELANSEPEPEEFKLPEVD
jgi:hypothetical protein